ncbi:glycerol-3-phosphate transporter permease [Herbaspirillum rubrisubalbicans]|jgi:sn-glycerol 3-phosphate transport system permease protein|uniref:sn-glycerol-3-phosphate transport system permease protein UgpA n=3 Tax=Herbaspirillum TaxID=963 RepID=A0ABX9BZ23_9BURK|nr:sugar ABC transporter permease [Herbaspirillum rubrisubalbicans]NQE47334.1 glycerol-3-phosphate transporter permease [Herbaspirillum rubrisubalbicans]QJQ01570.1 sugar ABC transporter permease [Herbaspirillum rubrisubalbicans Os34]RAM63281.1 glycerol-3-phosphate transporter permease [Herbaspirillum rubrisubalbicans]RAN48501.1 glycerol-3-phosphate transporter permease [Herbaspirillum rubrisubalbicans]
MNQRPAFPARWFPLLLATPQMLIVFLFFLWPAIKAIAWSLYLVRPFGNGSVFVGLDNYLRILSDDAFYGSLRATLVFTAGSTLLAVGMALALAACLELDVRCKRLLRSIFIWPYAVAGVVIGIVLKVLINPVTGALAFLNHTWPGLWAPHLYGEQAMLVLILAFAWTQVPLNFILFSAALQRIPVDLLGAAAIDGAGPWRRFADIQLPMIAPALLLACVINVIEAFTHGFGLVDALTQGGPGHSTAILAYQIYSDGFIGLDLSGSSALSVILMLFIVALTLLQLRFFRQGGW